MTRIENAIIVGGSVRRFLVGSPAYFKLKPSIRRRPHALTINFMLTSGDSEARHALRRFHSSQSGVSHRVSDSTIIAWLIDSIERGRLVVLAIPKTTKLHLHPGETSRFTIPTGGLSDVATSQPHGRKLESLSIDSKFFLLLFKTMERLPPNVQEAFKQIISPVALKMMVGIFVIWAGSHAFGAGEAIDGVLLAAAYASVGIAAIEGVQKILNGAMAGFSAKTDAQLDAAADQLASGLTIIGVNTLLMVITHQAKTNTVAAAATTEAQLALWEYIITEMKFPFDGTRGALWSRLGDGGARAASEASKEGLVTLEKLLEKNGFLARYKATFGNEKTAVTGKIWEWVSEKYASQLKGTVTVYTDKMKLVASEPGKAYQEPQLGAELFKIVEKPGVDRVIFKDISDPSRSTIWTRADLTKYRQLERGGSAGAGNH
jgi:hypothetical protein